MTRQEQQSKVPSLLTSFQDFSTSGRDGSMDVHEQIEALKTSMRRVSERIIGRELLVQQTALAILAREHQLIFARSGTAKTLYAQSAFGEFDAETFSIQLSQGTNEEAIIGAYDLNEFKAGRMWHRTQKSIVTADFAFLDEFMDANDMVLRSILGILNERKFSKGEQQQNAKLHTAIAVTNFLRQTGMSEAILDRFLFRARLNSTNTTLNEMLIDRVYGKHNGRVVKLETPLPMTVPRELARIVKGENSDRMIAVSYAILFLKNQIIKKYAELVTAERKKTNSRAEDIYVSPRTMAKARDVLNASALLNHRFQVTGDDLNALRFILTTISGEDNQIEGDKEQELFFSAVDQVTSSYSSNDLKHVEGIMLINEYYEAFMNGEIVEGMKRPRSSFIKKILEFFKLASWEEVSVETFLSALTSINIRNPQIIEMRDELVEKVSGSKRNKQSAIAEHNEQGTSAVITH